MNSQEQFLKQRDETYKEGFSYPERSVFKTGLGLNEQVVHQISEEKKEPSWMLEYRLQALKAFLKMPMPDWGPSLSPLDFNNLHYYIKPIEQNQKSWADVPEDIKNTFERLGVPQAEREFLAGVGAQYDSEVVYHNLKQALTDQGVIFLSPEQGIQQFPELFQQYFGTIVPYDDNKFAALNTAVWSGGSFVYVPKGVRVSIPLQAYFRINSRNFGQFERTLIITEEDSFVHYVEGCAAPSFSSSSLHSAVVELIALKGSRIRYTTIQNWSSNVYNLVTKRAYAKENSTVEWVDCNIGSKITMKYPCVVLAGKKAHGEVLSIAFAKENQIQDAGAKMIHLADQTSSIVTSKSISKQGGLACYRGKIHVREGLKKVKTKIECDALLLDERSKTTTYPFMDIASDDVTVEHEASVTKLSEQKIFYLQSRGLTEQEATLLIVSGFIEPLMKQLPMEYAMELNRLIALEMEGSVG